MRAAHFVLMWVCVTLATHSAAADSNLGQELELEQIVLLSRHGVRSPTQPLSELDRLVTTPWARWPVAPGELTPRGANLMRLMGGYYRAIYARRGLLSPDGCPDPGTVVAWADVDQRTRATAKSLLGGLFPGCGLREQHQDDLNAPDPLFHPAEAGVCRIDFQRARTAVLGRIGGEFRPILTAYARPLAAMQAILCPPAAPSTNDKCGLAAETSQIEPRGQVAVRLRGPIAIASMAAEIFLLESAEGMAWEQVAWGRVPDEATLRDLFVLHTLQFDLMERTRYIAQRQGSNLLATIAASIQNVQLLSPATAPRLTLLVGHDTNISNIAGLLGLDWVIAGFQPNQPSPGGALAFEVLRDPVTDDRYVQLAYHAQSLLQMREQNKLSVANPAGSAVITLPGCSRVARGAACPLARFLDIAYKAIDQRCVGGRRLPRPEKR